MVMPSLLLWPLADAQWHIEDVRFRGQGDIGYGASSARPGTERRRAMAVVEANGHSLIFPACQLLDSIAEV